jgi:hypothetical protein
MIYQSNQAQAQVIRVLAAMNLVALATTMATLTRAPHWPKTNPDLVRVHIRFARNPKSPMAAAINRRLRFLPSAYGDSRVVSTEKSKIQQAARSLHRRRPTVAGCYFPRSDSTEHH